MERLQSLLEEEELRLAASIAANAFVESPFYRYIFPDAPGRIAALTWMFLRNYRIRTSRCHGTFKGAYSADGKLLCCFWLFAEDVPGISLWDMLRHGLLEMPLRFGMTSMRRMLAVAKWTDQALDGLKQEHPKHVLLERMVVLPDYQGSGVGTAALTVALKEADAAGRAVILTTQLERNVVFYSRLGFCVVKEEIFEPDDGESIRCWFMVRHASTTS
ncbi:pac [Symbiodinium necroappetens]|uniref:Pac protein n=1 Tax=Symbiodinium necroappetens TaxID=1628268 RepID=A0A812RNN8_9DINO|nr:pac [Symbiodinium necroappetens]